MALGPQLNQLHLDFDFCYLVEYVAIEYVAIESSSIALVITSITSITHLGLLAMESTEHISRRREPCGLLSIMISG